MPVQEAPLTPSRSVVEAHQIELIEPVREAEPGEAFRGVPVRLTVSETGAVTAAEAIPTSNRWNAASADTVAQALTNARAATFEPFMADGVARPAMVELQVPLLGPERPVSTQVPFPAVDGQEVRIRLARTHCLGSCAVYTVTIHGDGTVLFEGEAFVAIEGAHRSRISPDDVQALLALFRDVDFFSLDAAYAARITDQPSQEVSLTIGDRTKSIRDYAGLMDGMPFGMIRLEHAIDRMAGTRRWVSGDASTAAALEAEGYDFTSVTAGEALALMAWGDAEDAALDFVARGAPLIAAGSNPRRGVRGSALDGAASNGRARLLRSLIDRDEAAARRSADALLRAAARSLDLPTLEAVVPLADFDRHQLGLALSTALNSGAARHPGRDPDPVVNRLLALHADVRAADETGYTALHGANTPAMVRRLLSAGADLEARNRYGATPVMNARDEDVVLALLAAGANPDVVPQYGKPLNEVARERGWTRVQARLAQTGS